MEDEADTSTVAEGDVDGVVPIDELPGEVAVELDPGVADDGPADVEEDVEDLDEGEE
jgi:hypothetical protein